MKVWYSSFAIAAGIAFALQSSASLAASFCDDLKTMVAAAPQFVSLRGEATGMEFHGSLKFTNAAQCEVRNKSDLDNNWQPINEKWSYECLWENKPAASLTALKKQVRACLPQAQYKAGSQFSGELSNFKGGVFHLGDDSIAIDFNLTTNQLWLTVLPAGVKS